LLQSVLSRLPRGTSYTLADVGCATGYYSEVIRFLCTEVPIEYTGIDYNQDSIDLARAYYPGVPFPDVRRYEPVRYVCCRAFWITSQTTRRRFFGRARWRKGTSFCTGCHSIPVQPGRDYGAAARARLPLAVRDAALRARTGLPLAAARAGTPRGARGSRGPHFLFF
jgi:hypothetical protein